MRSMSLLKNYGGSGKQSYITGWVGGFRGFEGGVIKFVCHHQWSKDKGRTTDYAAEFEYILID